MGAKNQAGRYRKVTARLFAPKEKVFPQNKNGTAEIGGAV